MWKLFILLGAGLVAWEVACQLARHHRRVNDDALSWRRHMINQAELEPK